MRVYVVCVCVVCAVCMDCTSIVIYVQLYIILWACMSVFMHLLYIALQFYCYITVLHSSIIVILQHCIM